MKPEYKFQTHKIYQFRVQGYLDSHWQEWLDELDISYEEHGITVLTGKVIDQPHLHGLLVKIRDLGLTLISFTKISDSHNGNISEKCDNHQ